jgi:hypothetical protein
LAGGDCAVPGRLVLNDHRLTHVFGHPVRHAIFKVTDFIVVFTR